MSEYRIGRLGGRFVVSWWEDGSRRRYRLAALTRKEAEAEALDRIRKETIPAAGHNVKAIWEAYRAERKGRPVAITMEYTGRAILPHFGALRPDQISTETCRAYTAIRRKAGRHDGSIWTELGHLRTTLQWAVKATLLDRAPHIERPAKPAPKDRWLTDDEIGRLIDAATQPHIRLACIVMLQTLARVGATLELTWSQVDFERGYIDLRRLGPGPRKGRAVIPMNAGLRAALHEARKGALSDHVIEWAGQPVKSIKKGFMSAVATAGLKGVSLHVLRHTGAVHMTAKGIPLAQVSQFMGHSNLQITERVYARFAPDHLRDAASAVDFASALGSRNPGALRIVGN